MSVVYYEVLYVSHNRGLSSISGGPRLLAISLIFCLGYPRFSPQLPVTALQLPRVDVDSQRCKSMRKGFASGRGKVGSLTGKPRHKKGRSERARRLPAIS
jgi:hypothetical protein